MHRGEMGSRMTFVNSVGFLLAFLALVSAEDEGAIEVAEEGVNVVAVIDDYVEEYDFLCHHCMKSEHGLNCITMQNATKIERVPCPKGEFFCTMEWEKVEGQMTIFTRGCAKTCESGCRFSDGLYSLEKCQQCCEGELCNYMPVTTNKAMASAHKVMMSSVFVVVFTTAIRLSIT